MVLKRIELHRRRGTLGETILRRLKAPLQLRPLVESTTAKSYSHSHLEKGRGYHERFFTQRGRRIIWELEQQILEEFAQAQGPFDTHLDFAGGTGRIASVFEKHCENQYLLDISSNMLEVAKQHLNRAQIVHRDFARGVPELENKCVDLVTAFRFFPNAERELRERAFAFLSQVTQSGGYLVCNNHRSFWSIPYVALRLTFRGGEYGMTNGEMLDLARRNGFDIVNRLSLGITPQAADRRGILPWGLVQRLESLYLRTMGERTRFGHNVIFIFRRM